MNPKDWAEIANNLGVPTVVALIVLLRIEPCIRKLIETTGRLEKAILLFVAANGSRPKIKKQALEILGINLEDVLEDGEE
jgi:hypothetical protein